MTKILSAISAAVAAISGAPWYVWLCFGLVAIAAITATAAREIVRGRLGRMAIKKAKRKDVPAVLRSLFPKR